MLTVVKAGLAKRTQVLRQNFMYVVVRGVNWDRDPPGPNKKSRDGEFIFITTIGQMRRSWHKKNKKLKKAAPFINRAAHMVPFLYSLTFSKVSIK